MPRRALPEITPDRAAALTAVEHATKAKRDAETAYTAAIRHAADTGLLTVQIATATGTTRQAVDYTLKRN